MVIKKSGSSGGETVTTLTSLNTITIMKLYFPLEIYSHKKYWSLLATENRQMELRVSCPFCTTVE